MYQLHFAHIDHVVLGIAIDEFVVGVDAGAGRLLIDDEFELSSRSS